MRGFVLALTIFMTLGPVRADPAFTPGGTVAVASVIDGDTIALSDGRTLRLVGIDAPTRGVPAATAKSALMELLKAGPIEMRVAGNPRDRQGRVLAQVYVGDVWVEGELLRRGLVRVRSTADNRIGVPEMLALERAARRYRRGIWADPVYAVRPPDGIGKFTGSFQIVSGTVVNVTPSSGIMFLDFGGDRRNTLAITIDADALKLCRDAGFDPRTLKGQSILVRGFIDGFTRPRLAVTHPEQIEIVARSKKKARDLRPGPARKDDAAG